MANLPNLVTELESASTANLYIGSTDSRGDTWRIAFDLEEVDRALELALGIAANPLSYQVT